LPERVNLRLTGCFNHVGESFCFRLQQFHAKVEMLRS
jgi:hypothetical protein